MEFVDHLRVFTDVDVVLIPLHRAHNDLGRLGRNKGLHAFTTSRSPEVCLQPRVSHDVCRDRAGNDDHDFQPVEAGSSAKPSVISFTAAFVAP